MVILLCLVITYLILLPRLGVQSAYKNGSAGPSLVVGVHAWEGTEDGPKQEGSMAKAETKTSKAEEKGLMIMPSKIIQYSQILSHLVSEN